MSHKHPVWYEPHPCTPERKAEIRALGFVIVDERFKPDGYENPKQAAEQATQDDADPAQDHAAEPARRGRKPKQGAEQA
jgi:hypothetical protein